MPPQRHLALPRALVEEFDRLVAAAAAQTTVSELYHAVEGVQGDVIHLRGGGYMWDVCI